VNIVCDRNKLFVSCFWKALAKLTRVTLKMSSSYHPEMDGTSERSNKTVNQLLHYHVKRNQKGWVRALPQICFLIMNTINASTGYSGFQLHLSQSPHVIPPLIPSELPVELQDVATTATSLLDQLSNDVANMRDNLLLAKITQAYHASATRGPEPTYHISDCIMLSTMNRHHEYKKKGKK